jgi:hypothetical protein
VFCLVAAVLLAPFWALEYRDRVAFRELQDNAVVVRGHVFAKRCDDHGRLAYRYVVDGQHFDGLGSCPDVDCDSIPIGAPVAVTYSRIRPNKSQCGKVSGVPSEASDDYFPLFLISAFVLIAILRATDPDPPGPPASRAARRSAAD